MPSGEQPEHRSIARASQSDHVAVAHMLRRRSGTWCGSGLRRQGRLRQLAGHARAGHHQPGGVVQRALAGMTCSIAPGSSAKAILSTTQP